MNSSGIIMNPDSNRKRGKAMEDLYYKFRKAEKVREELKEMDMDYDATEAEKHPRKYFKQLLSIYENTTDIELKDILRDELRRLDNIN